MTVVSVTDASFEKDVLRSELPVLVDLYADWCQPCKAIAPIVAALAVELEGKVKFAKVDVEKNQRIAASFRVQSIPMLVVIHQSQIVNQHTGAIDKKGILALLEPVLPAEASELKPAELAQLVTARRVVAVDIRDERSYARFRIPGAVHVPSEVVLERAEELTPADGRLRVLYGRSDEPAKELAKQLGERGVEVGFLAGGFLHWEADGFEVERG